MTPADKTVRRAPGVVRVYDRMAEGKTVQFLRHKYDWDETKSADALGSVTRNYFQFPGESELAWLFP